MKRVRMVVTKLGSVDGIKVQIFKAGEVYVIPAGLADVFLSNVWAEEDKVMDEIIETKDIDPKNKKGKGKKG